MSAARSARPPTRILFACDSFKATLPSHRVGEAAEKGIREALQNPKRAVTAHSPAAASSRGEGVLHEAVCAAITRTTTIALSPSTSHHVSTSSSLLADTTGFRFCHCPMSDGGAGLLDSLTYQHATPSSETNHTDDDNTHHNNSSGGMSRVFIPASYPITGPLGTPITNPPVSFACCVKRRTLVIEMAEASGLPRVPAPGMRNPLKTTSYGTGETLRFALRYMEEAIARDVHDDKAQVASSPQLRQTSGEVTNASETERPAGSSTSEGRKVRGNQKAVGVDVFLGIGGSATNDGGLGALQGLGVIDIYVSRENQDDNLSIPTGVKEPLSKEQRPQRGDTSDEVKLSRPFRGEDLARMTRVALRPELETLFSPCPSDSGKEMVQKSTEAHTHVYIRQLRLICDVDNPLVGPRGATYTFGPQKCAPQRVLSVHGDNLVATTGQHDSDDDDGAVGVVSSQEQQAVLDTLEAGMCHAVTCAVTSTCSQLRTLHAKLRQHRRADAIQAQQSEKAPVTDVDAAVHQLLHGSGGGGAGGMSGFFRYFLGATWMAGTDAVAELLALRVPPSEEAFQTQPDMSVLSDEVEGRGLLYTACDVLVTGEGSFDAQTISSHKTVGRLLEMVVEANLTFTLTASRQRQGSAVDDAPLASSRERDRSIREVIIVCGRMGFKDDAECQRRVREALVETLLPTRLRRAPSSAQENEKRVTDQVSTSSSGVGEPAASTYVERLLDAVVHASFSQGCDDSRGGNDGGVHHITSPGTKPNEVERYKRVLEAATPRVTVLPLSPEPFSVKEAMTQPYACVQHRLRDYCLFGDPSETPLPSTTSSM